MFISTLNCVVSPFLNNYVRLFFSFVYYKKRMENSGKEMLLCYYIKL